MPRNTAAHYGRFSTIKLQRGSRIPIGRGPRTHLETNDLDAVAQTFQTVNQLSHEVVFVELVQVKIAEFVAADLVGKHVIDGHQDVVGHAL